MSRRDDTVPMRHMLDYARETVAMVSGRSRSDVDIDRMLQLALTRLLEMIGEAANRGTAQGRARYQNIPWQNTVWKIIKDELPVLIAVLERALPGHVSSCPGFLRHHLSREKSR